MFYIRNTYTENVILSRIKIYCEEESFHYTDYLYKVMIMNIKFSDSK